MTVFSFYVELVNEAHIGETGFHDIWTLEKFPDKESLFRDSDIHDVMDGCLYDERLTVTDEFTGEEFVGLEVNDADNEVECSYGWRVTRAAVVDGLNWEIDYVDTAELELSVTGDTREQAKLKCEELAKRVFILKEYEIMEVNFFE